MALGFRREAPGQHALCKICRGKIAKGEPAVMLDTWVSSNCVRLFFHLDCFPEKQEIK